MIAAILALAAWAMTACAAEIELGFSEGDIEKIRTILLEEK